MSGGVYIYPGKYGQPAPCFCFITVNMKLEDAAVFIGIGLNISNIEALEFIRDHSKYDGDRRFTFPFTEEELEPFKYQDCVKGIDWDVRREYENLSQFELIRKEYFRNKKIDKII